MFVNLFLNLLVLVLFFEVTSLVIVIFVQVNSVVLVPFVQVNVFEVETVKHEAGFLRALLAAVAALLVQLVISSVVKGISGRGVRKAGRGYMDKNF